ncbi:MAG: hypothetical protein QOI81_1179 [Actinomycetota bacterium]|jgi:hypothetical protein|nr:hypothetical protein [Actinomycetota bacterium]
MADTDPVAAGKIALHQDNLGPGNQQACGTCGAVVAYAHVARHIAWHAQAAWAQATVTSQGQTGP